MRREYEHETYAYNALGIGTRREYEHEIYAYNALGIAKRRELLVQYLNINPTSGTWAPVTNEL